MNETEATETAAPTGAGKRNGKRYSAQQRARLIREYEASGKTGRAFSSEHGICAKTFYGWLKKAQKNKQRFAEVKCSAPQSSATNIEIRFPGGVVVVVPAKGSAGSVTALVRGIAAPNGSESSRC